MGYEEISDLSGEQRLASTAKSTNQNAKVVMTDKGDGMVKWKLNLVHSQGHYSPS